MKAFAVFKFLCSAVRAALLLVAAVIAVHSSALAAAYSWDPGMTGTSAGGGTGNWNTTSAFWFTGTADAPWTAANDAAFGGAAGTVTVKSGVSVNDLTFNTSGYTITGNTLTITGGSVSVPAGSDTIGSVIAATSNITKLGAGNLVLSGTLNLAAASSLNIEGGSVTVSQLATFNQSNSSTFNGNLVIANPIRVNFNSPAIGSTSTYNGSGSIQIQSSLSVISNASGSYGGAIGAPVQLNALNLPFNKTDVTQSKLAYPAMDSFVTAIGATKNGTSNHNLIINGVISGNSDVVLATNDASAGGGAGIMQLNAQNTYSGTTFIDGNGPDVGTGGAVILGASNALPVATDLVFGFLTPSPSHNPGLDLNGNNQQIGSLSMSSTADLPANQSLFSIENNLQGSTSILTVSGSTTPGNPFGGRMLDNSSGSGGTLALVKAGPNTLTLTNSNTYSGGTTIYAGTLVAANSTGSATGLGTISLDGGTLASGFTGSIAGNVIAGSGPHAIAPGGLGNVGTLVLSGNLNLNGNSTLDFDVSNDSADLLRIAGPLSVNGAAFVDINASGMLSGPYTLATYGSSSGLNSGDFNVTGMPAGYALQVGATQLSIVPVSVPEPSSIVLLLAATSALIGYRCRKVRIKS
jgi:fibronectin-binding autotransporter adhesin